MTASSSGRSDTVSTVTKRPTTSMLSGWAAFAAVMLCIVGALNVVEGYVALQNSEFLVNQLLFQNMDFWGWTLIVWGALQLLAGALSFGTGAAGPAIGITLSTIGAVLWFFLLFAAPFAAIIGVAMNVAIIYGLTHRYGEVA